MIANEHFEICKALKSDEARRHFHVHAKAEMMESDADKALMSAECGESPVATCPQCNGEGTLEFDEDDWEIKVVPDDTDTGDEES